MKNVVLKNSRKFQKVSEKVFTDRERNSKIRKDNPLKVNCKNYRRGSGLYNMKETETILLNEIVGRLALEQKIVAKLLKKMIIKVYKMGIEKGFNSKI